MCLFRVPVQAFGIGEDGIGEMVVFVNKEINLLVGALTLMIKVIELVDRSVFCVQYFLDTLWQKISINIAEVIEADLAMCIQSLTVIMQSALYAGEVEIEYQIAVAVLCGMLSYVEVTIQVIENVAGTHIIIMLQHAQSQAFAETAGTDKEVLST